MFQKRLFSGERLLYSFCAAAKSAAGRRNPCLTMATQHAPGVFFYVAVLICRFFCAALCVPLPQSYNGGSGGADFGQAGSHSYRYFHPRMGYHP